MALKPTIYKFRIALSDMNNDYYDSKNLTIALHPSEKPQRMLARILAFCLNAQKDLNLPKASQPRKSQIYGMLQMTKASRIGLRSANPNQIESKSLSPCQAGQGLYVQY